MAGIHLDHVARSTTDVQRLARFYEEVFGFQRIDVPNFGFEVVWLNTVPPSFSLHIIQKNPNSNLPESPHSASPDVKKDLDLLPRSHHISLGVPDYDGFVKSLKVSMASSILRAIGLWLADHTLDELIENTSGPDITAESNRLGILHFIEKKDKADSERRMWGLLRTYNQIFMEANVLLYFKRISGVISMGGPTHGFFPNLHKFWEMIVGKKIFSSQLSLKIPPQVHPEARALLKTQMILLIECVGFTRKEALDMIDKNWREELRMEINYHYGHYWETPCCVLHPRRLSLDMLCRNGRIWDAAEEKWYAGVRRIYQEEILGEATNKALDPTPKGLKFWYPPREYEPAGIDANGDWFNEDAERSAQELWKILESKNAWPGWDEARKYCNLDPRDLSIKIPLIPKE